MSTADLALEIGRSVGYVNNLENDRNDVSVTALNNICNVFGVHISWFFQVINMPRPEEAGFVVREDNRRLLQFSKSGIREELLSPTLTGKSQIILSTFRPGAVTGEEPTNTDAEMAGVVISGSLELTVDDQHFELSEGDSFLIPPGASRKCRNSSENDSVTLWAVTPPLY